MFFHVRFQFRVYIVTEKIQIARVHVKTLCENLKSTIQSFDDGWRHARGSLANLSLRW